MRRFLLSLVVVLLAYPFGGDSVAVAQHAASSFAGLGLPELTIVVTASSFDGIPESIPAGRYLVTVIAGDDVQGDYDASVAFMQDPDAASGAERDDSHATSILEWTMAGGTVAHPG